MKEQFLEQYDSVFNDTRRAKNYGHVATKRLIELADQLEPSVSHGDTKNGFLSIDAIQALKTRL